jgi:uncharacterized protein YceK
MNCRTLSVWVALVALLCGGCGTKHNLFPSSARLFDEPPKTTRVYGGVRDDLKDLDLRGSDVWLYWNLLFVPFTLIDLPLSFVGDTLTLPYTTWYALFKKQPDYLRVELATLRYRYPVVDRDEKPSEVLPTAAQRVQNLSQPFAPANSAPAP